MLASPYIFVNIQKKFVVKHGKTSVDKNGFCSKMKNELGATNNIRSG